MGFLLKKIEKPLQNKLQRLIFWFFLKASRKKIGGTILSAKDY